jgi:gas vesicle protein
MRQMTEQELQWGKWLGGAALGAVAMYMLDPERGGPRRALSSEKIVGLTRQTGSALGTAWRGIGSRLGRATSGVQSAVDSGVSAVSEQIERVARPDGAAGAAIEQVRHLAEAVQDQRSPAMRNAALLGGGALGAYGLMRRSPMALVLGALGVMLLTRASGKQDRERSDESRRERSNIARGAAQQDGTRQSASPSKFLH